MPLSKDKQAAYLRDRYRRRRLKLIAMMGGSCARCGAVSDLEFHHKNQEAKEFDPGSRDFRWERVAAELQKCELLCEACHTAQHATTHGQTRMYGVHGCRCEACVKAWRAYRKRVNRANYDRVMADPVRRARLREQTRIRQRRYRQEQTCRVSLEAGNA